MGQVLKKVTRGPLFAHLKQLSTPPHEGSWRVVYKDLNGKWQVGGVYKKNAKAAQKAGDILDEILNIKTHSLSAEDYEALKVYNESSMGIDNLRIFAESFNKGRGHVFQDLIEKFMSDFVMKSGYSQSQEGNLKRVSSRLADDFGGVDVRALNRHMIKEHLEQRYKNPKSFNTYLSVCNVIFKWLCSENYLESNPAQGIMNKRVPKVSHEVYSPIELESMLKACPEKYLPWLVLSAFEGMRAVEIYGRPRDRESGVRWEDINFDTREIYVNSRTAKKTGTKHQGKPRVIPLSDATASWLFPLKKDSGRVHECILPSKFLKSLGMPVTKYLGQSSGCGWKENALRASRASYRLAILDGDVSKVKYENGHSEAMLTMQYNNPRFKADAVLWFSLSRDKVLEGDKVIKIA